MSAEKLREQFHNETNNLPFYSNGACTSKYARWLEELHAQSQLPKEGEEVMDMSAAEFWDEYPEARDSSYFLNYGRALNMNKVFEFAEEYAAQKPTTLSLPTEEEIAQERYQKAVLSLNERATNTGEFGYMVVCELMKIAAGLTSKE
jgi:hypothetical protein